MNFNASLLQNRRLRARGLTLIEISVTLFLLLSLASVTAFSLGGINKWKLGRRASVELQTVYLAQKSYLADHPTKLISAVTAAELEPYLPSTMASIPTAEALDGTTLTINFTVMPPLTVAGGTTYDPSGSPQDGLWDVGRL